MAKDLRTFVALPHFDEENARAALKAIGRGLAAMYGQARPGLHSEAIAAACARLGTHREAGSRPLQRTAT
jgi:hypothetical protein